MTELLLNNNTSGGTTLLANGDIIFKDIGGDGDYTINNHYNHTFDAGLGYKVQMEIRPDWNFEEYYDRLAFRTKETDASDWVNGNVPWFIQTTRTDMGSDVWGTASPFSLGDGWLLPYNIALLNNNPTYHYVSGTAVDGFIPINYVGDTQIVSWHFFSDHSNVASGWEIKISRVPIPGYVAPVAAGPENAVTCMGTGVCTVTNTGSITCS